MYVYLSKILPVFVMPIGVTLFLSLVAFILLRKGKSGIAAGFLALAMIYLYAMATPYVGERLEGRVVPDADALPGAEQPREGHAGGVEVGRDLHVRAGMRSAAGQDWPLYSL